MTNSYVQFRDWVDGLDLKAYVGMTVLTIAVVSLAVFGIMPRHGLLLVNAAISGAVWSLCVIALLAGGRRLDVPLSTALALIAGGLTTSIPSIFYEHTPVDWGSTLSRLGVLILVCWAINSIFKKMKGEDPL